ncbi:hypothetical protein CCL08_24525, partial [Pseudomonas congelans]
PGVAGSSPVRCAIHRFKALELLEANKKAALGSLFCCLRFVCLRVDWVRLSMGCIQILLNCALIQRRPCCRLTAISQFAVLLAVFSFLRIFDV